LWRNGDGLIPSPSSLRHAVLTSNVEHVCGRAQRDRRFEPKQFGTPLATQLVIAAASNRGGRTMSTIRSFVIGTGRCLIGLMLINAGIEITSSPELRQQTSSVTFAEGIRALSEGILRDVASIRGGD
jgi:hypothetical protein